MHEVSDADRLKFPIIDECVRAMRFDNGRYAGVVPFLFTWAIVADFTSNGYCERWCYSSLADALGALDDWDGEGEPSGWHRHPASGRRRNEQGQDIGEW